MRASILTLLYTVLVSASIYSQTFPKSIDGTFTDWTSSDFSFDDGGDSQSLDIIKVSIANDDERLFLLLETNSEFDMQDDEDITVFIDADNNPNTGFTRGGIGAEFTYYFSAKRGFINMADGSSTEVNHAALGAMSSPTVTSDKFELVLDRSVAANGFSATMGNTIAILIENDSTGDVVPNVSGGIEYTLCSSNDIPDPCASFESTYNLNKDDSHTRFMSYNVLQDGLLSSDRKDEFEKIITAMNPDIIAFQEVYNTSTIEVQNMLADILPLANGQSWQVAKSNPDIILATRFQIEAWDDIDGNAVFLLYDDNEEPILVYNVHLPCCANDDQRQDEIDKLLSVLRDKESSPLTGFLYPEDAPTIITGDFNLVGLKQNYLSFIEGDIVDNNTYGQDFNPDWDGSVMEDADPQVTGYPGNYTWNNPNGSYHPGKLDLLFYTGSVMQQQNAFILDTEFLSATELSEYNLSTSTTTLASDHLPLIVDFTLGMIQVEDIDGDGFTSDVDCNDNDPLVNPNAIELCNGIDDNCSGLIDDQDPALQSPFQWFLDSDNDGYGNPSESFLSCTVPAGYTANDLDCDDNNADVNPAAIESCDGIDNNCNGMIDDQDPLVQTTTEWFQDSDGDGFGNAMELILACNMPTGYIANNVDCDDTNPNIFPGADEVCDNVDNNCDGFIDENLPLLPFYYDGDTDGYGDDTTVIMSCFQPFEYISIGGDCDDTNLNINPGATEIPNNGIDENCDGADAIVDLDNDGFNSDIDCNDNDPNINPDAIEICDGIDNNCDGNIDENLTLTTYYLDNDLDGFGDNNNSIEDCLQPIGYILQGGDCDDASANVYPSAIEICDDIDNNCDGNIDEGISFTTFYPDNDMDGFGNNENAFSSCEQPPGTTTEGNDCNDADPTIYPGAPEILDNDIDEDCDGFDLSDTHEIHQLTINIYPNPTTEKLFINLNQNISYNISLTNVTGQVLLSQQTLTGNSQIDLSEVANGMYFLMVSGVNQKFAIVDRIVVFGR